MTAIRRGRGRPPHPKNVEAAARLTKAFEKGRSIRIEAADAKDAERVRSAVRRMMILAGEIDPDEHTVSMSYEAEKQSALLWVSEKRGQVD